MSEPSLDLTTLISTVRSELERSDLSLRAAGKPALFVVDSLELELSFVVKENEALKGGFDLKIVSLGSTLGSGREEVQKIKIKFRVPPEVRETQPPGYRHYDTTAGGLALERVEPLE
jgi:hypothetical protein